jgi:hypothetical protein
MMVIAGLAFVGLIIFVLVVTIRAITKKSIEKSLIGLFICFTVMTFASIQDFSNNTVKVNKSSITMDEFCQIKTDMPYNAVVEIIGAGGTVISETKINNYETIIYEWEGEGCMGANANITLGNGRVASKAQYGLK